MFRLHCVHTFIIQTSAINNCKRSFTVTEKSNMAKLREELKVARRVVFLTGAGISAESGLPTFRGEDGMWRKWPPSLLASLSAFRDDPGLVWEFYHYRREMASKAQPNSAHKAIAAYEAKATDKHVTVVTQNVDNLHARAGTKNLVEMHGNLFKTKCTKCGEVLVNHDSPICESLRGRGSPEGDFKTATVAEKDLPHCKKPDCGGILRPFIVWFGEALDADVLRRADEAMSKCDVCLLAGSSSLVVPASLFAPMAAVRGATVAEFNLEPTPVTDKFKYFFKGPCGQTLPYAVNDDAIP